MYCDEHGVKIGLIDCNNIDLAVGDRVKIVRKIFFPSEDGWGRHVPNTKPDAIETEIRYGTIIYSHVASRYFIRIDNWSDFPISQFENIEKIDL